MEIFTQNWIPKPCPRLQEKQYPIISNCYGSHSNCKTIFIAYCQYTTVLKKKRKVWGGKQCEGHLSGVSFACRIDYLLQYLRETGNQGVLKNFNESRIFPRELVVGCWDIWHCANSCSWQVLQHSLPCVRWRRSRMPEVSRRFSAWSQRHLWVTATLIAHFL